MSKIKLLVVFNEVAVAREPHFPSCSKASSAIEFAVVSPLLIGLVFGIYVVGMYCATINGLEQLASGAARQTIAGLNDAERLQLAKSYIDAASGNYPYLQASAMTSSVTNDGGGRTTTVNVSYDTSRNPAFSVATRLAPIMPRIINRYAVVPQGGS